VAVQLAKETFRKNKEERLKNNFENICKLLSDLDSRYYLQTAAEKGASSWLAVLPLKNSRFLKKILVFFLLRQESCVR
jgi:hypothetical protein